jgi:nucleotide-binding universal stress UspA family protein
MFSKILVALDGSDHAEEALKLGCGMATACGSQLILLHAVQAHPLQPQLDTIIKSKGEDIYQTLGQEHGEQLLDEAEKKARNAGLTDIVKTVVTGGIARKIVKTAGDSGVDLIVIGTRGLNGIREIAVGSVAHKVTITASCPVLVVK